MYNRYLQCALYLSYTYVYVCILANHVAIYFSSILVTRICFGKSSVHINENHRSLMFTLNLTDPLSTDITVTVITTDGTATGELLLLQCIIIIFKHIFMATYCTVFMYVLKFCTLYSKYNWINYAGALCLLRLLRVFSSVFLV